MLLAFAQEQVLVLDQATAEGMNDVLPYMSVLVEDDDCHVETVLKGACDDRFRSLSPRDTHFRDGMGFIWVKLRIRRDIPSSFIFNLVDPTLPSASLYALISDSTVYERHISEKVPMSQRAVQSLEPVFIVTPELGVVTTVYLRMNVVMPKHFPIYYGTPQAFLYSMQRKYLWNGLYFGAMLIMGLYNLFIWFTVRDRTWLYYSLYVFAFAMVMAYARGFAFLYFWPEWPQINQYPNLITGWAFLSVLAFSSSFLGFKERFRGMYYASWAMAVSLLLLMVTSLMGYRYQSLLFTQYVTLLGTPVLLYAGYRVYRNGYKPARFYLAAWSVLLGCAVIFILANQGVIVRNVFTISVIQIGSAIEMLLLSYALADKINMYRAQSLELQSLNELKTRLFSVVSHDVRYPLASLTMLLDLHESGDLTPEERDALLADVRRSLGTSMDMLDGVLQWSSSQMRRDPADLMATSMEELVSEHVKLIQTALQHKNLHLKVSVRPSHLEPYIDRGLASLALRNLLSNAVKFTPSGGTIKVDVEDGNNRVLISVSDTGVGMSPQAIAMLHANRTNPGSSGTDKEPGAGLGLILLKHMLDASGGTLHVESQPGSGSRFTVGLPKAG